MTPPSERSTSRRHSILIDGTTFDYDATGGTLLVHDNKQTAVASIFYLSYVSESRDEARRPITFVFNGGPGSSSLWANIGQFGPKRAATHTPSATPPPPYLVEDNPHTLLAESDLVFIDAVETGYSRVIGDTATHDVWGVDQDVDVFARVITRYLTVTGNWNAPRFLYGESYGTTRAAALVYKLQSQGIDFNGVMLQSTLLDWTTIQPGADQKFINILPSFAAAAWYHKRQPDHSNEVTEHVAKAWQFAQGSYASALQRGDTLGEEELARVAEELSYYMGLGVDYLVERKLRVEREHFRLELLRAEGKVIGRFDSRFVADNSYVVGDGSYDPATNDAATAGSRGAFLSSFRAHLTRDVGFTSDLDYYALNNVLIEGQWDWSHKAPGIDEPLQVPNVGLDLAAALRQNPNLKVFVLGGIYDFSTPFYGAQYDISHLFLATELRANIWFQSYPSGHATFVDAKAAAKMKDDLGRFYAAACRR
ncbi:MAG: S10 family peptidase [Acidimicrobiales bacterium]